MNIQSEILNYALATEGLFYTEEHVTIENPENPESIIYNIYFNDYTIDIENAIKVNDSEEDQVTIYTTSQHDFNNGLGFMVNIASTTDKDCADMLCEALNVLKEIYTKSK